MRLKSPAPHVYFIFQLKSWAREKGYRLKLRLPMSKLTYTKYKWLKVIKKEK